MNISNEIKNDEKLQKVVELFASELGNYIDKVSVLINLLQNTDPQRADKIISDMPEQLKRDVTENLQGQSKEHWNKILSDLLEENLFRLLDSNTIYNNKTVYNKMHEFYQKPDYADLKKVKSVINSFFPEYSDLMNRTITSIDDLQLLSKWDLNRIMMDCQPKTMAKAMCAANEKVKTYVLSILSTNAKTEFLDYMEAFKDDAVEIQKAEAEVVMTCHKEEAMGNIIINAEWMTGDD